MSKPLWQPSAATLEAARVTAFMRWLALERDVHCTDYASLWRWSVTDLEEFWSAFADWLELPSTPRGRALAVGTMPGARWFPGVELNYVEQVFRHATAGRPAVISCDESGARRELSWAELHRQVAALAATLRGMGVGRGDRVAAYLPNIPETVVAFLATASLGAVWSVCAPEMGGQAVLDRFRQIAPKVMIAVDGCRYAGKSHGRLGQLGEMLAELPSVRHVVLLGHLDPCVDHTQFDNTVSWAAATAGQAPLQPRRVPFEHPLWIVYSSGTTGPPKPIVHSQGGVVLEHAKLTSIHLDLGPEDRFHWFSSAGWMMWNVQVAGLLCGATICLYDGSPVHADPAALWRFVGTERVTFFGAGAALFQAAEKAGLEPARGIDLAALRAIGSTGSPLGAESYRWIHTHVRPDLWINPISGGTDIVSAFVGGVPILPVHAGEMQCRCLGAHIEAYDEAGVAQLDRVGELVCTRPMPSMPVCFWNDADNRRYLESYFDVYPGVWRHGDWIRITPRGGAVIYGRSDATINRQGVRMGTSELYRTVEELPEVLDSLVVDLEYLGRPSYMPLFVVLRAGETLTPALRERIRRCIRDGLSARHVPDELFAVPAIPRTLSGKKLELPIRRLLLGQPLEQVVHPDALANPESLVWFGEFARLRQEERGASAR